MKLHAPHTSRNSGPIVEVLGRLLPDEGLLLEIAAGSGENALHGARALPGIRWQPSDRDAASLASIDAWRAEGPANLLPALHLDVEDDAWPVTAADAILCCNMIHIAPWSATLALLRGARRVLRSEGPLILYGPFHVGGQPTSPSNAQFDASLRGRDPRWGIRDVDEVSREAARCALDREEVVPMPANNLIVSFRRR